MCVIPAEAGIQVYSRATGNPGNIEFYLLDSRFRGNDRQASSPGLAFGQAGLSHQGRGELLHSAKVLLFLFGRIQSLWQDSMGRDLNSGDRTPIPASTITRQVLDSPKQPAASSGAPGGARMAGPAALRGKSNALWRINFYYKMDRQKRKSNSPNFSLCEVPSPGPPPGAAFRSLPGFTCPMNIPRSLESCRTM